MGISQNLSFRNLKENSSQVTKKKEAGIVGIRKSYVEELVVEGTREQWLHLCPQALTNAGFKKVASNNLLGQVSGNFKPIIGTLFGEIIITLLPEENKVKLHIEAVANVDNVYALAKSPGARLITKFKEALTKIA